MNKIIKPTISLLAVLVFMVMGYKYTQVNNELEEYKLVYDGLELFEDGSWDYKQGTNEYYFWNWNLKYINKKYD